VVTLTGPTHNATVGQAFTIDFSAVDPSPEDHVLDWVVDWGDNIFETFGAGTSTAVHVFALPGVVSIVVNARDKDTKDNNPPGTDSNPFKVTVGLADTPVKPGGYHIKEGDPLTLTASADGTPEDVAWDLNGDGMAEKHGATVTYGWDELEALGI